MDTFIAVSQYSNKVENFSGANPTSKVSKTEDIEKFVMLAADSKVTICHISPDNVGNAHAINVGKSAWGHHMNNTETIWDLVKVINLTMTVVY